jgi:hypothetical protein
VVIFAKIAPNESETTVALNEPVPPEIRDDADCAEEFCWNAMLAGLAVNGVGDTVPTAGILTNVDASKSPVAAEIKINWGESVLRVSKVWVIAPELLVFFVKLPKPLIVKWSGTPSKSVFCGFV